MIADLNIKNKGDVDCLIGELENQIKRESLLDFTISNIPDYEHNWFHESLCNKLEQFYEDVKNKKSPRLMIFAPPRHGKSELASRQFPAWCLGKDPNLEIIAASYASSLAQRMGKDVKKRMSQEDYRSIFPETVLPRRGQVYDGVAYDNTNDLFQMVGKRGSYRPAGVDGGITGMGADILIIDDPVKGAAEANSPVRRESVFEWYSADARTRVQPGGGILIILTRWHKEDLAGMILKRYKEFQQLDLTEEDLAGMDKSDLADNFEVFSYPAIATEDEEFRKKGEALHPERYPLGSILKIKNSISRSRFDSLYQQSPKVKGGHHIKSDWWQYYSRKTPPPFDYLFITADTAQKTKEENDYSVLSCWGVHNRRLYLWDMWRDKWDAPTLQKKAELFWQKHKGDPNNYFSVKCRAFYVEDKSSGTGLIQTLRKKGGIPIIPIQRSIDKLTRCEDTAPWVENGSVFLPDDFNNAAIMAEEAEGFPNETHDDTLDTLMDAVEILFHSGGDLYNTIKLEPDKIEQSVMDGEQVPDHILELYHNM